MSSSDVKSKLGKEDLNQWGGNSVKTFTRRTSDGGLLTLHKFGNVVDVLQVYGDGSTPAHSNLTDAIVGIEGQECCIELAPGTWPVTANLTIPSTITVYLRRGAVFSVSAAVTLTLSGPVIAEESTWYTGAGTVAYTAGGGFFPLVDDLASTAAGKGSRLIGITGVSGKTLADLFDAGKDVDVGVNDLDASGNIDCAGLVRWDKGADIASQAALTLGTDGNYFDVTGTTGITSIATSGNVGTTIKLHFDGAVLITHQATDLILPGGQNITTATGDELEFTEYASGDWRLTAINNHRFPRLAGSADAYKLIRANSGGTAYELTTGSATGIIPTYKNLKVTTPADNQSVAITADKVLVVDTNDLSALLSTVSVTVDLDTAGTNGLDTGSIAANTGYFLYVIYNGSTVAGLASTSATAPTMPSGYTYKALVGWCTTDGTATPFNIGEFIQIDDVYLWTTKQKVVDSGGSANTATLNLAAGGALSYAVVPPSITKGVFGKVMDNINAGYLFINPVTFSNSLGVDDSTTEVGTLLAQNASVQWSLQALTESQTLYYQMSANTVDMWIAGFTLKR